RVADDTRHAPPRRIRRDACGSGARPPRQRRARRTRTARNPPDAHDTSANDVADRHDTCHQHRLAKSGDSTEPVTQVPVMFSNHIKSIAVVVLTVLAQFTAASSAQSFKATVIGTVVDPTGAVIPGATVTIVQDATGLTQTTTTGADGTFSLPQLPPGRYVLTVELNGFHKFV